jgi:translation elongation factor EF-Tu-like GTPase
MYDIKAEIRTIATELGGRKSPFSSGLRPEFYYDNQMSIAAFYIDSDIEWVYPGQTVVGYFEFLSPSYHFGKLYPGKEFTLYEGSRILAEGKVLEILDLEESAKRDLEYLATPEMLKIRKGWV